MVCVLQLLAAKYPAGVHIINKVGESALHVACACDKPDNAEHLLRWGCNGKTSRASYRLNNRLARYARRKRSCEAINRTHEDLAAL
jgi:hypothetical protein